MQYTFQFRGLKILSDYPQDAVEKHLATRIDQKLMEDQKLHRKTVRLEVIKASMLFVNVPLEREIATAILKTVSEWDEELERTPSFGSFLAEKYRRRNK